MTVSTRSPSISERCCANCDTRDLPLFPLSVVRPTGKQDHLLVCRFCYLRLASVEPHRARTAIRMERA